MEHFWIVARQVWILFALIGVGVACRRFKLIDDISSRGFVNVLLYVVTPCLIIDVFQRPFDPSMLRQLALAFAIAVLAHGAVIALARVTGRSTDPRQAAVLRLATVFSNAGFMGLPLEQAVLGDRGVFFGSVYVAVFNLFCWSWGLRAASPAARGLSCRAMIVNPGTIGLAVGLPLFLFSVRLPDAAAQPVALLSALNTPVAMLLIGYYLGGAKVLNVFRLPAACGVMLLRLVICPLLLVAALFPFRALLDPDMSVALVTAAAAPVAAMVAMFAARYDRDVELAVGLVSATTLVSLLTLPAVVGLALSLLGRS